MAKMDVIIVWAAVIGWAMSAENNNGKDFVAAVFLQKSVCCASLHFTGNEGTTVHIEAFDFSNTTTIGKDLWAKQDLNSEICFDVKNETTATKGIRVTASDDISVAAMTTEHGYKSESYLVLPTSQLSIEYYAVSAIGYCAYSKLMIIATAASTEITLTLRVSSGKCTDSGYEDGKTIKVKLDKMEVFGLYCKKDITGTHIISSKPVAVVSGCQSTRTSRNGGFDPVADMLIPVQLYGTYYILYNINTVLPVVYRVVAAADNTDIVLAGQADHVLQEGGFIDIRTTGTDCLTASSPVLVVAFTEQTSTFGDPLMAVVQSTDHFMSSYLVYAQANPISERTEALIGLVSSLPNIDVIVSGAEMTEVAIHAACGFSIGTFKLSSDSVVYLQSSKPFGLLYIRVGTYNGMGYSGGFKNAPATTTTTTTTTSTTTTTTTPTVATVQLDHNGQPVRTVKEICTCFCKSKGRLEAATTQAISEQKTKLKKKLQVKTANLTSAITKKTSATDSRMSSTSIGYATMLVVMLPVILLMLSDVLQMASAVIKICKQKTG